MIAKYTILLLYLLEEKSIFAILPGSRDDSGA